MRRISGRVRKIIATSPEYRHCMLKAYKPHVCGGRITMEHAIIHAGRQVDEIWAIVSVCASGQEVDFFQDAHTMDKNLNRWVALNRATDDELLAISKVINYIRERERLNQIYGPYEKAVSESSGVNYPEFINDNYQIA